MNDIIYDKEFNAIDYSETKLENDFESCTFINCSLSKVNFITSINFTINPELNSIKKAKFSKENVIGLLQHIDID